jgi:hypothetical protein
MAAGSAQARTPTFDVTLAQILAMEPIQKTMSWARTFASYILINNFWIEMERRISPPEISWSASTFYTLEIDSTLQPS